MNAYLCVSTTPFVQNASHVLQGELIARWVVARFALMEARLSRMILHSASAVSQSSLPIGVPLALA